MISEPKRDLSKWGLGVLFLLCALPFVSSPIALVAGLIYALTAGNPLPRQTAVLSKLLLKVAVIGLGFGVNFQQVISIAKDSLPLTLVTIVATVLLGAFLGRVMSLPVKTRALISFGTAICGGSAIAALAPVIKAENEEVAVSLATVFTLNAVGLLVFPPIGVMMGLDQQQFGVWAALAIHDTSSVVGAAATFGGAALAVATTVKLSRALWIVPCTLAAGWFYGNRERLNVPWFMAGFVLTAFISSWWPEQGAVWSGGYIVARQLLVMTLFLIGVSLTRETLQRVGLRPLGMGALLWTCVTGATLLVVLSGVT
ncbi:MAG: putative sulfate exporter family transporter [Desulfuromonas sp.]|nr:MAG: putative sulfate exporter family transporter [Desulfuromonas sp.]